MDRRLCFADKLPYSTKHPILLPKDHPVMRSVIINAHERLSHEAAVEQVLTELQSCFWIVKGRLMVGSVTACAECQRHFTRKIGNQMMAPPLPKSRLQSSLKALEKVVVYYGGPFLTKQGHGRTRTKHYLCLFTCLTIRAVHLEISYSLDTGSSITAFTWMTSKRGTLNYVISDNGTNFIGACVNCWGWWRPLIQTELCKKPANIIPLIGSLTSICPHFGGVFEALINSAKKAIIAILGDADIADEELHTAICGLE